MTLRWQQGVAGPARLRLTVAFDARENARLLVRESSRGDVLGEFDIRFAYPFQPFDLELTERQAEAAAEQGVTLELVEGFGPLWFFSGAPSEVGGSLLPHLRRNVYPSESCFTEAIRSLAAAQPFGWMEGCVMDGLHQRARLLRSQTDRIALERHIQAYFDHRDTPRYVPHTDAPVRHGSEGLLPFAVLAQYDRSHPSFQGMLEFCQTAAVSGVIRDGQVTTAEGCYTLAYPLAVLGVVRDDHRLRDLAVGQLLHRIERLVGRGVLYLRAADTGARTFPNWARGLAWFALGIIRTVDALPAEEVPPPVIEAFRWCAELALKWQHPTGLWSCFIDQPETGIEASGSAGIAAALTVGARLLPDPARALRAARAAHGALLSRHLVPGGFLGTVSQANRDGERLQRSGYRVIGHFGAGLLAQLDAALRVSA
ncbi:MAG: glycoside hydrolase family 88 protein [Bryobacterales bacterium]|nr:glycoside hydrolase family 88 protein [Bryobacteraceae bacterium]MDW8354318.1 glycoside hydrolase family 88 protein [Bryobacterales bacterium]